MVILRSRASVDVSLELLVSLLGINIIKKKLVYYLSLFSVGVVMNKLEMFVCLPFN